MPWKWNIWSNLFMQVLQQWGLDYIGQADDAKNKRSSLEHKKNLINKLTNRLERVGNEEKE